MKKFAFAGALLALAASAVAKERTIVDPLTTGLEAHNHVTAVEVIVGDTAAEAMTKFDEKASEKRTAAHLAPVAGELTTHPEHGEYATLPFRQMFPLVMQDVTQEWGLIDGRSVKLTVTIDTLKTANAAMAMLIASSDQLAGNVQITDAETGEKLGSFYIDVINAHSGLLGLAARGSGVRESLSEEFALQTSRVLTGRKSKKPRKA